MTAVIAYSTGWGPILSLGFIFGAASAIDANVTRDSNATRDIVRSSWYRETFAHILRGVHW